MANRDTINELARLRIRAAQIRAKLEVLRREQTKLIAQHPELEALAHRYGRRKRQ